MSKGTNVTKLSEADSTLQKWGEYTLRYDIRMIRKRPDYPIMFSIGGTQYGVGNHGELIMAIKYFIDEYGLSQENLYEACSWVEDDIFITRKPRNA